MHYDLSIKKQRQNFWKDCEKTLMKSTENVPSNLYSWSEAGRSLTPLETYEFWDEDGLLWDAENPTWDDARDCLAALSKNVMLTFEYYDEHGLDELYASFDEKRGGY